MEGPDPRIGERSLRGETEPEPSDHDIDPVSVDRGEPEPRELLLGVREQTRHEVLVAELHLGDVSSECQLATTDQREHPHAGRLVSEDLETCSHHVSVRRLRPGSGFGPGIGLVDVTS